jgi:hypothetical protein
MTSDMRESWSALIEWNRCRFVKGARNRVVKSYTANALRASKAIGGREKFVTQYEYDKLAMLASMLVEQSLALAAPKKKARNARR